MNKALHIALLLLLSAGLSAQYNFKKLYDCEPQGSSLPHGWVALNNLVYFVAKYNGHEQLWGTDGTGSGTFRPITMSPTPTWSPIQIPSLHVYNGNMFFWGDDGSHGPELFISNGNWQASGMLK